MDSIYLINSLVMAFSNMSKSQKKRGGILIFNESKSFSFQLITALGIIIFLSTSATLAICLSISFTLGSTSYDTANDSIRSQTESNVLISAKEIALAIDSEIRLVAHSVNMKSARYTSGLFLNGTIIKNSKLEPILMQGLSFHEYDFVPGCSYPKCPSDFGSVGGRSRIGFNLGSMDSSSVYVFHASGGSSSGVRNDTAWNDLKSKYPDIQSLVDVVQPQDLDMKSMYSYGPNSTEMFYLSLLYPISDSPMQPSPETESQYISLHRTYPGILKDSPTYDPPHRPWFQDAPIDDFHLYGPYLETFTQLLSITMSSRSVFTLPGTSKTITAVSGAVMLLSSLSDIINKAEYPNSGFGALIKYDTHEVVVYGNQDSSNFYQSGAGRFRKLSEVDPELQNQYLNVSGVFEYKDSTGEKWIVASVPFFEHASYSTGKKSNAFIMLVFSKSSEALESLPNLQKLIDKTTLQITLITVFVCAFVALSLLALIMYVVRWLTGPLAKIRRLSEQIVEVSAEEDSKRNYKEILENAQVSTTRGDEIGTLAVNFLDMVNKLHHNNEKRKQRPRYPKNPFYLKGGLEAVAEETGSMKWVVFEKRFRREDDVAESTTMPAMKGMVSVSSSRNLSRTASAEDTLPPWKTRKDSFMNGPRMDTAETMDRGSSSSTITALAKERFQITSLRFYWYTASFLLLFGLSIVLLATLYQLRLEGTQWLDSTGESVKSQQILNLKVIADAKSKYISSFFVETRMNLLSASMFLTALEDGVYTNSNSSQQSYLRSYSLDRSNYFAAPFSYSNKVSGYFVYNSTACKTESNCSPYQGTPEVQLTSLDDLQLQSYFHNKSNLDFFQGGFAQSGLTRNIPYVYKSYGAQKQCYIEDLTFSFCKTAYYNSKCSDSTQATYPPYDPRCRSWYHTAINGGNPREFYVQYPRIASTNNLDVTAVTPVRMNSDRGGRLYGVLNSNVLAQTLSDSVNSIRILQSGYCYLIDTTKPEQAIIHPSLSGTVTAAGTSVQSLVKNLEGFSDDEFSWFETNVLTPIKNRQTMSISEFMKGGSKWALSSESFQVGTVAYTLIATVPLDEVLHASQQVQDDINSNVLNILLIFIYVLAGFTALLTLVSLAVIQPIVRPLNELRAICQKVAAGEYDVDVPKCPSSLDMKVLLHAFSNMLVAIKFGSDSYARGHVDLAQKVFKESLRLYSTVGNKRGVGVSQNNLGAVDLSRGDYRSAEAYFKDAVANARDLIETSATWESAGKAQRVLSDRLGNLALAYMEQGRIDDAASLLYDSMEEDKRQNYIRGYIVKQGTLGQLLLKKKAYDAATRVITDALQFAGSHNSSLMDEHWTAEEAAVTEQIALCNIGLLYETQGRMAEAEEAYLDSLTYHDIMHISTTTKALMALRNIFVAEKREDALNCIDKIALHYNFKIVPALAATASKRVALIFESSGQTEKAVLKNILGGAKQILKECLNPNDLLTILRPAIGDPTVISSINHYKNYERWIEHRIDGFVGTKTGGSLFKAINYTVNSFDDGTLSFVDWVIVFTDSQNLNKKDDAFKTLRQSLSQTVVGIVIVGIGEFVQKETLRELALFSRNGLFTHIKTDDETMEHALVSIIQFIKGDGSYSKGQLVLEEV